MLVFITAYSSCARNLPLRDSGFFVQAFSGEYAFRFSTGIGTEPKDEVTIQLMRIDVNQGIFAGAKLV
jgi:hypothetical protein